MQELKPDDLVIPTALKLYEIRKLSKILRGMINFNYMSFCFVEKGFTKMHM